MAVPLRDWLFSTALTWLPGKPEERGWWEGWESANVGGAWLRGLGGAS